MKMYDDYGYFYHRQYTGPIDYVYQFRHAINVMGWEYVEDKVKLKFEEAEILYKSYVHGSVALVNFYNKNDEEFLEEVKEREKERYDIEQRKEEAKRRGEDLVQMLEIKRKEFAGIGTNKAKRRLNKLAKEDVIAKAVRLALEIEDKNIQAKKYYGDCRDKTYKVKKKLINELSEIFKKNKWCYGIQESDLTHISHVIYFEIPGCEQVSWHIDLEEDDLFPIYEKEWDGKHNSSLVKLEVITMRLLKENGLL